MTQRHKKIDVDSFRHINRIIKTAVAEGNYNASKIAAAVGTGVSTIRDIRRAKTWPAFERAKAARNEARRPTGEATKAPVTAINGIQNSAPLPKARPVKLPASDNPPSEEGGRDLAKKLEERKTLIGRTEFTDEVHILHERANIHFIILSAIVDSWIFRVFVMSRRKQVERALRIAARDKAEAAVRLVKAQETR